MILTGLQNHANGQFGHAHDPHNFHTHDWVESIPRLAKAHGFGTGVIGKLHVLPPSVYPWDYEPPSAPDGGTRNVDGMAQQAREFFRKIGSQPFYLHVGFGDPHRAGDRSRLANDRDYPKVERRIYSPADVMVPPFLSDRPEVRRELISSVPGMTERGIRNQALVHWPDILPTLTSWMGVPEPQHWVHGRNLLPVV